MHKPTRNHNSPTCTASWHGYGDLVEVAVLRGRRKPELKLIMFLAATKPSHDIRGEAHVGNSAAKKNKKNLQKSCQHLLHTMQHKRACLSGKDALMDHSRYYSCVHGNGVGYATPLRSACNCGGFDCKLFLAHRLASASPILPTATPPSTS